MFAYIKGSLEEKSNGYVVIDVCGIGYKIFMSDAAIQNIGELGNVVKVHTYYYVREDNISLYGFISKEELTMFELLLSVSGIGAKSAITMLSNISPSSFALAIISNDIKQITKIPGIGSKTAQRIVLELKDKLKTETTISKTEETIEAIKQENVSDEAVAALQILGYNRKEIDKVLEKLDTSDLGTEDIIRAALKYLGRN